MTVDQAIIFAEGHRGYHIADKSVGLSDNEHDELLWRWAPRGRRWGNYIGSECIRGFRLKTGRFATSLIKVSDKTDNSGRRGYLHAHVLVMSRDTYTTVIRSNASGIRAIFDDLSFSYEQRGILESVPARSIAKLASECDTSAIRIPLRLLLALVSARLLGRRAMLACPYRGASEWYKAEDYVLSVLSALPKSILYRTPFSTLSLDPREEGIYAMPDEELSKVLRNREMLPKYVDLRKRLPPSMKSFSQSRRVG